MDMYLKLLVLIYADYTIVMSDTKERLQRAINVMASYWKCNQHSNEG